MQSAKKTKRILSAISMAAAAAMSAQAAHGMTLTTYYGNDPSYANSNNAIIVGTGYNPAGYPISSTVTGDAHGGLQYFSTAVNVPTGVPSAVGGIVSSLTGGIQTITIPVGDYVSLAIDALLTGNVNADAGVNSGKSGGDHVQPSFLGLAALDINTPSTNAQGNILSPITASVSQAIGAPSAGYTGTVFYSTTQLNATGGFQVSALGANGGAAAGSYNRVPNWISVSLVGGVEPNNAPGGWNAAGGANPSTDSGANASGNAGINSDPSGGNSSGNLSTNPTTSIAQIEYFAASTAAANATPAYGAATEFMDSLIYQGLSSGLVTLSPTVNTAATSYWNRTSAGNATTPTGYGTQGFDTGGSTQTINNAPLLVIDVISTATVATSHAIVALAATAAANTNYPTAVTGTFSPATNAGSGKITVTGAGSGSYIPGQVTAITAGSPAGNVGVTGWNPGTDPEVFGVDVKIGGVQATGTQLAALVAAINSGGGGVPASSGVSAGITDPTLGDLSSLDTATTSYNLFLKFAGGAPGGGASDDLGIDLSNSNDSNLTGYTFTAVAVVPEPMSLGLLALGGVGLMARRNRRKS